MMYKVISSQSKEELQDEVSQYIARGWKPTGGIFVEYDDETALAYHQAIWRQTKTRSLS